MASQTFDIAVVGHLAIDTLKLPSRTLPFTVLGGAAAYTSFATRNLDATAAVISKVGENFPEAYLWWLDQEGVDVSAVKKIAGKPTTCFELTYSKDLSERALRLTSKGPQLSSDDTPKGFKSHAIHIGPIANEVPYELVETIKGSADVLSLDPQGLLRSFDQDGNVIETPDVDFRVFELVDIFKSSKNEICTLTGESELKHAIKAIHDVGVETVIVTKGEKGAVLSVEGVQYDIDACPSQVIVDPTGAGDVFIAGFLTEYIKQKESLWCASVGSAAASCVIEGLGPTCFGKKEEIYRRANSLYEKKLKQ